MLSETKGIGIADIVVMIEAMHHKQIPRGTVHSTLRRGQVEGKYLSENGLWRKKRTPHLATVNKG